MQSINWTSPPPVQTLQPCQELSKKIALGQVPYKITPCPVTGGHHEPIVLPTDEVTWVDVECKQCKWVAMGYIYTKTEDELWDINDDDPDWFEDIPVSDVSLEPDDQFNDEGNCSSGTVYLWKEYVRGGGTLGLDVTNQIYHTHDRLPIIDPNEPDWPLWLLT